MQDKEVGRAKALRGKSKHPRLDNDYTSDSDDAVVDNSQPGTSNRLKCTRQL